MPKFLVRRGVDNTGNQYLHKTVYMQFSLLQRTQGRENGQAFINPRENGRRWRLTRVYVHNAVRARLHARVRFPGNGRSPCYVSPRRSTLRLGQRVSTINERSIHQLYERTNLRIMIPDVSQNEIPFRFKEIFEFPSETVSLTNAYDL